MANMAESFDISGMMEDISSELPEGARRINPGDQLPEEIYEALRSARRTLFDERDGTQDNSNGH